MEGLQYIHKPRDSTMFCSISGEVPEDPVVSKLTGHLYERRVITRHIAAEHKARFHAI